MKYIIILILAVTLFGCSNPNDADNKQCSGFITTGQNVQPCYAQAVVNGRCQQHR